MLINMFDKKYTVPAVFIIVAALSGCFSPWQGGDDAVITLNLGNENVRSAVSAEIMNRLNYTVVLTGSLETKTIYHTGAGVITAAVTPGAWEINAEAWLDDVLFAIGSGGVNVKAGQRNTVTIKMSLQGNSSVTGVTLDIKELKLNKGETKTLTAAVAPQEASNYTLTWTSSNTAVATVSNGKVTAVGLGEATITAAASGGIFDTCKVTVTAVGAEGLVFDPIAGKNEYSVTDYNPPAGTVSEIYVPDTYNGWPVTEIVKGVFSVFSDRTDLITITLPFVGHTLNGNTDTYFGWIFGAYDYNDQGQNSPIPESLEAVIITGGNSIGDYAFFRVSLTSIFIPPSVTTIGSHAFNLCGYLNDITISEGVTTIRNDAFNSTSITSIAIPASVREIGFNAFNACSYLTTVTFKTGSVNFDDNAFPSGSNNMGTNNLWNAFNGAGTYERDTDGSTWTKMGEVNIDDMTDAYVIGLAIQWQLDKGYDVTVTGTQIAATGTLTLNIPVDMKVKWDADIFGSSQIVFEYGGGDFIIAANASITTNASGYLIKCESTFNGRIIVNGLLTNNSSGGPALNSDSGTIIVDGGTIQAAGGNAIQAYNGTEVTIKDGSLVITMATDNFEIHLNQTAKLAILGGELGDSSSTADVVYAEGTNIVYVAGGTIKNIGIISIGYAIGYYNSTSDKAKFNSATFTNLQQGPPPDPWW